MPPSQGLDSLANLRNSLPNGNLALKEEQDLMNNFKAAALSITTLYRSGLQSSKRAYSAGYEACLQDVLELVQAGVSDGINAQGTGGVDGQAMSVGRVMDWVEARLEDIKEDKREEDRRKGEESGETQPQPSTATLQPRKSPPPSSSNIKTQVKPSMSPTIPQRQLHSSSPSPSPAPPSSRPSRQPSRRENRERENQLSSATTTPAATAEPFSFVFEPPEHLVTPSPNVGTKRRHATMMFEHTHTHPLNVSLFSPESISPPTAVITAPRSGANGSGSNRRKGGKLARHALAGNAGNGNAVTQSVNVGSVHEEDCMQVEFEEGRERKRVARR